MKVIIVSATWLRVRGNHAANGKRMNSMDAWLVSQAAPLPVLSWLRFVGFLFFFFEFVSVFVFLSCQSLSSFFVFVLSFPARAPCEVGGACKTFHVSVVYGGERSTDVQVCVRYCTGTAYSGVLLEIKRVFGLGVRYRSPPAVPSRSLAFRMLGKMGDATPGVTHLVTSLPRARRGVGRMWLCCSCMAC